MHGAPRAFSVTEELHLVDLETRRPVSRAPEVLDECGEGTGFSGARHGALVNSASGSHTDLDELGRQIRHHRALVARAARRSGTGVLAAGSLASPGVTFDITPGELGPAPGHESRTRASARFTVHVELEDPDQAQFVARRIAPHVPVLLALAASSPFWGDGKDSGYASTRAFEARFSPSHLTVVRKDTVEGYHSAVEELIDTGVVTDAEHVDVDVRPSEDGTGVELRACDSCPTVDTILAVAALFRALVARVIEHKDEPWEDPSPTFLAAASWRAARSGLEGDLIDVAVGTPRPASDVVDSVAETVAEELAVAGDDEVVRKLLNGILAAHSSAARQRAIRQRRGRRRDVVDVLLAESSDRLRPREILDNDGIQELLTAYQPMFVGVTDEVHDEAVGDTGQPRTEYVDLFKAASELGAEGIRERQDHVDEMLKDRGVLLKVYGYDKPQVFPLDPIPRILPADQWGRITAGIEQRARALEMFLQDIYSDEEIVKAGIVSRESLERAPGYRAIGRHVPAGRLHSPICGVDLVSVSPGEWVVLEDNLRMPGGLALSGMMRKPIREHFPEFQPTSEVWDPDEAMPLLKSTLEAAAPGGITDPHVAVCVADDELSSYDLNQTAKNVADTLLTPRELRCTEDRLVRVTDSGEEAVDVLYVRLDEDMLFSSEGADGRELREDLLRLMENDVVAVVNAPGNGAGDDKAIYPYVPDFIDFYLGEKPLIGQVDTFVCADRNQRDEVVDRLSELVVKPIDGYGGSGITVGPECSPRQLDERREELRVSPERFVAQEVQRLSTLPTFDGRLLQRRHVDMRAFVFLRNGTDGEVLAAAAPTVLTRVAPEGTMVVNGSSGGGGKDTWIHRV